MSPAPSAATRAPRLASSSTRPSGGEPRDRLAHRRARDAELGGDALLVQSRLGLEVAREDLLAQDRVDAVRDRGDVYATLRH
jgi:hypothetical protein